LKIDWKIEHPNVSEKDLNAPKFKDIKRDFVYQPG
jgi:dTDP-4-dehydrorhamnose 3,5-epimerase-like enzyme